MTSLLSDLLRLPVGGVRVGGQGFAMLLFWQSAIRVDLAEVGNRLMLICPMNPNRPNRRLCAVVIVLWWLLL